MVIVGCFAVAGLWASIAPVSTPSMQEQTRAVAQTLRCPTCIGEDVADSASPIAQAMRLVVAEQLAEGRSGDEVRAWFADRYGDDVLLDPPRRGAGWLLWLAPLALLGMAAATLTRRHVGNRRALAVIVPCAVVAALIAVWAFPTGHDHPPAVETVTDTSAIPVLVAAVAQSPGSAELRIALARNLETDEQLEEAADHYGAAVRLRPMDADLRYRHAFSLLRAGEQEVAENALEGALDVESEHAPSLLLLGTIRQYDGDQSGEELLRQFLEVAPDHRNAQEVRDWLEGRSVPVSPGGEQ